jgi:hypothetical protein
MTTPPEDHEWPPIRSYDDLSAEERAAMPPRPPPSAVSPELSTGDLVFRPERVNPDAEPPEVWGVVLDDEDAMVVLQDYWRAGIPVQREGDSFYLPLGHDIGLTAIAYDAFPLELMNRPRGRVDPRWRPERTWVVAHDSRRVSVAVLLHPGGVTEGHDYGIFRVLSDDARVLVPPTKGGARAAGPIAHHDVRAGGARRRP